MCNNNALQCNVTGRSLGSQRKTDIPMFFHAPVYRLQTQRVNSIVLFFPPFFSLLWFPMTVLIPRPDRMFLDFCFIFLPFHRFALLPFLFTERVPLGYQTRCVRENTLREGIHCVYLMSPCDTRSVVPRERFYCTGELLNF